MEYDDWKKKVNRLVFELCGMYCDDLPDVDYYEMYLDDRTPQQAARHAIMYARRAG